MKQSKNRIAVPLSAMSLAALSVTGGARVIPGVGTVCRVEVAA